MYLLDTNILIYLIRKTNTDLIKKIKDLLLNQTNIYLSIVTIGEIKSFSIQRNWSVSKDKDLDRLLNMFRIININNQIIENYAEIDSFSQGKHKTKKSTFSAKNMGKNDLWIASSAMFLDAYLITTDNDFNHLEPDFIKIIHLES